jgi:predicted pyridoxine 5'-phosphate oxidase superfamily flavin-nucleotide-binding protein
MRASPGRYHAGERAAQRRAGVADEAEAVGRIVGDSMSPAVARFLRDQRLAIAASLDAAGRPWASILSGPMGFLQATDETLLRIDARPADDDPLTENVLARPELGLLVLDPATRRRMRLNGRGLRADDALYLLTDEVYGNCPKYIRPRRVSGDARPRGPAVRASRLDAEQMRSIAAADTFFVASFHPDTGADASHRGGDPGFVRVRDDRHLEFPDHPGNAMFNTLGNLLEYPRMGLLFVDFATGDTLQLTGRAQVRFEPERSVAVEVDEVAATAGGHRLVWEPVEAR